MSNGLSWAKEMNTIINHFFQICFDPNQRAQFFFALAKQLNSIIIVQYYMSEGGIL
jgi:hypothetical protein